MNEVSVTIAGSVCNVSSSTATTITCVTGAQRQSQETKVRVSIADRGVAKMVRTQGPTPRLSVIFTEFPSSQFHSLALFFFSQDNADFFYIDVWSSRFTWGGLSPPEKGTFAVITKGQTILLDTNTPVLKMLLIQGDFSPPPRW